MFKEIDPQLDMFFQDDKTTLNLYCQNLTGIIYGSWDSLNLTNLSIPTSPIYFNSTLAASKPLKRSGGVDLNHPHSIQFHFQSSSPSSPPAQIDSNKQSEYMMNVQDESQFVVHESKGDLYDEARAIQGSMRLNSYKGTTGLLIGLQGIHLLKNGQVYLVGGGLAHE